MFKATKTKTIAKDSRKYLSFPDIVKSPKADGRFFLVYREGESHHPTWSNLVLLKSDNYGKKWAVQQTFPLTIEKDKYVWNCPRLSYVDDILYITCDQKSGIFERRAHFKTVHLTSKTEGEFFRIQETMIPGMVPDKIIEFKDKLVCANHKIKDIGNKLVQLISWSRDGGKTWYDTNLMADDSKSQFCEASVVNMGDYLIAYLRDNSGHKRNVYTVTSGDGINWSAPCELPIFGQRVTALKYGDKIIGAYRNADIPYLYSRHNRCKVSIFEHDLENNELALSHIDKEFPENQYHFGYTGMAEIGKGRYLLTYYIKKRSLKPYIKLAFVEKVKV